MRNSVCLVNEQSLKCFQQTIYMLKDEHYGARKEAVRASKFLNCQTRQKENATNQHKKLIRASIWMHWEEYKRKIQESLGSRDTETNYTRK